MGLGSSSEQRVRIRGVIYSDEWIQPAEEAYVGIAPLFQRNKAPEKMVRSSLDMQPLPGELPYTVGERLGFYPLHPSRLRPRQYYYPTTDFSLYTYDQIGPEEKELKARWSARMREWDGTYPMMAFMGGVVLSSTMTNKVLALSTTTIATFTGCLLEAVRTYMAALPEREDLDDFLVAKEIWYIKNVETKELGLLPKDPELEEFDIPSKDNILEEGAMDFKELGYNMSASQTGLAAAREKIKPGTLTGLSHVLGGMPGQGYG